MASNESSIVDTYRILSIKSTSSFDKISKTNDFNESNPQFVKILLIIYTRALLFLANKPILS